MRWPDRSFSRCRACGLLWRDPLPSDDELGRLYEESWEDPGGRVDETGGTDPELARLYAARFGKALGRERFDGLRILEFGAGRGAMIAALAELGAEAYAVERFGHDYLGQRGIRAWRSLDEIPQGMVFDGIVSIDVIEHLPRPWVEMRRLEGLMARAGWIYLATPNSRSLNARLSESAWREARKPGHLVLFSARSLGATLRMCGYGRCRRLRWFVTASRSPARRLVHYALQGCRLDGELRYIAYRS